MTIDVSQDVYDRHYASAVEPPSGAPGNGIAMNYDLITDYPQLGFRSTAASIARVFGYLGGAGLDDGFTDCSLTSGCSHKATRVVIDFSDDFPWRGSAEDSR